jgi:hypothetical protein
MAVTRFAIPGRLVVPVLAAAVVIAAFAASPLRPLAETGTRVETHPTTSVVAVPTSDPEIDLPIGVSTIPSTATTDPTVSISELTSTTIADASRKAEPPSISPSPTPPLPEGAPSDPVPAAAQGRFAIECVNCEDNDDGFTLRNGALTGKFRMSNVGTGPLHIWFDEKLGLDVAGWTWTLHQGTTVQLDIRACSPIHLDGPGTLERELTFHTNDLYGDYSYRLRFHMVPGQPIYPC